MKKLNNMVIVERKIVNGTQSKGRIDVNFATKRQCMPLERATKLQEEDELMTQENESVSLFKILGDAYQIEVKVGGKKVSKVLLLEEIEESADLTESNDEKKDSNSVEIESKNTNQTLEKVEESTDLTEKKKAGRPKAEK